MYTWEKRRLIYIMTSKTTWWHTHCLTPGKGTPLWYDPTWVIDTCELCEMDIDAQDWWSGVCYNASQRKLFDDININRKYWVGK